MRRIRLPRWLYPGMHLKRWLLLSFVGITILGLGAAKAAAVTDDRYRYIKAPREEPKPACLARLVGPLFKTR